MTTRNAETDALALGVYFVEPETTGDVERLRQIRNDCRQFMTENRKIISPAEQQAWWHRTKREPRHRRVWLVKNRDGVPVGYVLLAFWHTASPDGTGDRDGGLAPGSGPYDPRNRANVTVALAPDWRGRGIGTEMFRFAAEQAKCRTRAIIRMDNPASIRAAQKAGYGQSTFARGDNTTVPDVVYYERG